MSNLKKILIFTGLGFLVALILIAFSFFKGEKSRQENAQKIATKSFTIPGVPWVSKYNHVGRLSYATGSQNFDSTAGVISVMEYWNPGQTNFSEVRHVLDSSRVNRFITIEKIKQAMKMVGGYDVKEIRLTVDELSQYVNSDVRTPLLFNLPIDENQPETIQLHPMKVLVGVDYDNKKVIAHDFWLGNNYEISFDLLEKSWQKIRDDHRYAYVVLRPVDWETKVKEIANRKEQPYPNRTTVMIKNDKVIKNMVMGMGALNSGQTEAALVYYDKAEADQNFNEFTPNFFKVAVYRRKGQIYTSIGELEKAMEYLNKAIIINQDHNKPFKDFPGYEYRENRPDIIDRDPSPYATLGDLYLRMKMYDKAVESYKMSLDIRPDQADVTDMLKLAELELVKNK